MSLFIQGLTEGADLFCSVTTFWIRRHRMGCWSTSAEGADGLLGTSGKTSAAADSLSALCQSLRLRVCRQSGWSRASISQMLWGGVLSSQNMGTLALKRGDSGPLMPLNERLGATLAPKCEGRRPNGANRAQDTRARPPRGENRPKEVQRGPTTPSRVDFPQGAQATAPS